MSQEEGKKAPSPSDSPSVSQKWSLIAQNLKSWHLFQSNGRSNSKNVYLSDPEHLLSNDERVDQMLDSYRSDPAKGVTIWYLHSSPPERLNAKFLARGVGIAGRVQWMWFDLLVSMPSVERVEGVVIETGAMDHSGSSATGQRYVLTAYTLDSPEQAVGSVTVILRPELEEREYVIAGLFNMSVLPTFRNRGIGAMLAKAACDLAKEKGCRAVFLNATSMGKRLYERMGFEMLGRGYIWHLDRRLCKEFYEDEQPRREVMRFLEAVCLGEVDVLEQVGQHIGIEDMQQPTRNGMTPLEIALHCGQTGSAEWLVQKGVVGDILSLWDLGWKDRVRDLVSKEAEGVNVREGRSVRTAMDVALQRDDQELAALLASVPPPRVAVNKDSGIDFGAVDWAKCFDRADMADLDLVGSVEGNDSQAL